MMRLRSGGAPVLAFDIDREANAVVASDEMEAVSYMVNVVSRDGSNRL
jgi:hypothetical protein